MWYDDDSVRRERDSKALGCAASRREAGSRRVLRPRRSRAFTAQPATGGDDGPRETGRITPNAGRFHRRHLPAALQGHVGNVPMDITALRGYLGEPEALAGLGGKGRDGTDVDRSRHYRGTGRRIRLLRT